VSWLSDKRGKGRPPKLTKEVQDQFVDQFEKGYWIETACANIGLSKCTYYAWMKRGEAEELSRDRGNPKNTKESLYLDFLYAVRRAIAEFEVKCLDVIYEAALERKDTAEVKWVLSKKNYERYGDKQTVRTELTGRDGGAVEVVDARAKLAERLNKGV